MKIKDVTAVGRLQWAEKKCCRIKRKENIEVRMVIYTNLDLRSGDRS